MDAGQLAAFSGMCYVAASQAHRLGLHCAKCGDLMGVLAKFEPASPAGGLHGPVQGTAWRMIWMPVERN